MFEKNRDKITPFINIIAKPLSIFPPNFLTLIGFLLSFIPMYFFAKGNSLIGGITMLVLLFDSFDGAVARLTNKKSVFGEVLDSSLDRIVDAFIIFSIIFGGFISWQLGMLTLIGSFMVSYMRARGEAASGKSFKLNVGIGQRGDRLFLIILGSVFYFENFLGKFENINSLEFVFFLQLLFTWITVIWRFIVSYKNLK